MSRHSPWWRGFAVVVAIACAVPIAPSPARATSTHRAGVVVDMGNGTVVTAAIDFDATINGIEALQLAGFAPIVRSFGGLGGAVCGLEIEDTQYGCPADSTCLTCAAPKYWVYFRAPAGSSAFATSRVGAGAVSIHDGDVEGWRWGTGNPPPTYVPLSQMTTTTTTGLVSTTTTARATTSTRQSTVSTHTKPAPTVAGAVSTTTRASQASTATTRSLATASTTQRAASTTTDPPTTDEAAQDPSDDQPTAAQQNAGPPKIKRSDPSHGPPVAFFAGVAVLVALAGLIVIARRRTQP